MFHQLLLRTLGQSYRSVKEHSSVVLSVCNSWSSTILLSKTTHNSPSLEDIYFKWKKAAYPCSCKRGAEMFSLLNGTSWKIFCILLSLECPWGHPSESACTERQSRKHISHLPTLHSRGRCTKAPVLSSCLCQGKGWGHTGLCMKRRVWMGQPLPSPCG